MIRDFTDNKIKCFTEEVIDVKKMDIEFICTDQGAHRSVEEALKAALGDEITCEHIGCQDIQDNIMSGDHAMIGVESLQDQVLKVGESQYETGVPDFNGNTQMPASGVEYMLIVDDFVHLFRSQAADLSSADAATKEAVCESNSDQARLVSFESLGGGRYRVNSAGRLLTSVRNQLRWRTEVDQDGRSQEFRMIINPGGSVTIQSAANNTRVLRRR